MKTNITREALDKLTRNTDKLLMHLLSADIKKLKPRNASEMKLPVLSIA